MSRDNKENYDGTAVETRGLVSQSREGIKLNLKLRCFPSCLIVTDSLPSILWLMEFSSNFLNVYLFICESVCYDTVKKWWKDVKIVDRKHALEMLFDAQVLKVGIGKMEFIWDFWKITGGEKLVHSLFISQYNRLRKGEFKKSGIKWVRIGHQSIGGLTSSKWLIGTPNISKSADPLSTTSNIGFKRKILSIVDEGITGCLVDPPSNPPQSISFSAKETNKRFTVPCYRSRTGWVSRQLTFKEKALCLDFNELLINKIEMSTDNQMLKQTISLAQIVPNKILQLGVNWILRTWGDESGNIHADNQLDSEIATNRCVESTNEYDSKFLEYEKDYLLSYGEKASKNDDEAVPVELWDRSVLRKRFTWLIYSPKVAKAIRTLRDKLAYPWYLKLLRRSFVNYLKMKYGENWMISNWKKGNVSRKRKRDGGHIEPHKLYQEFKKDISVGRDILFRAGKNTWWEWDTGSTCNFWRWPSDIVSSVRDGVEVHIESKLPNYRRRQILHLLENNYETKLRKLKIEIILKKVMCLA